MTDDIDKYVSERVREARLEAGLTLVQLAAKIGVSYQQLQKYEAQKNRVPPGRLWLIAGACGKSIFYFFPGDKEND